MTEYREDGAFGDLAISSHQELVVVLVEPADARNIGAVARAMSNLKTSELRLVSPGPFDRELARGVACWGAEVLDQSSVVATLTEAVSDCHEVVGFASDSGRHRVSQMLLDDWVTSLRDGGARRVALVFGSEENGLSREHFPLCQFLIRIPSSGNNRSYNLAQSVLLALYAIRTRAGDYVGREQPEWPTSAQFDAFSEMVLRVADDVGFLNQHSPPHIRDLLLNVSRRGRLTVRELKILTGLFGMIERNIKGSA